MTLSLVLALPTSRQTH